MRLMGIDYGSKRVGVALTDDAGMMAFPHGVLENSASLVDEVVALITEKEVKQIVVGLSYNQKGGTNPIHEQVKTFVGELRDATDIEIAFEPEQYTTQEALHIQGRNSETDASAATIILNSYITRMHNSES